MLVTELAHRDMNQRGGDQVTRLRAMWRWLLRRPAAREAETPRLDASMQYAPLRLVTGPSLEGRVELPDDASSVDVFRWRRHPQLLEQVGAVFAPEAEGLERRARSAAVRGLFLARSGRTEEAREAFAIGAAEPSVDLTAIPGFWDLSRAGMLAAVGAYDDVERYREASALGARIRLKYRPRPVRIVPGASDPGQSASGS